VGNIDDAHREAYGDNSLLFFNQFRNAVPGQPLYQKARTGTNAKNGDGFFDHMVPPYPPSSVAKGKSTVDVSDEFLGSSLPGQVPGPYGLGPRVPMLVVSPWSPTLPEQETGRRRALPLPYDLTADGRLRSGRLNLTFSNHGAAGASFYVTSTTDTNGPWTYTVGAGKQLSDDWSIAEGDERPTTSRCLTDPASARADTPRSSQSGPLHARERQLAIHVTGTIHLASGRGRPPGPAPQ
jgi:hypothetical protein